MRMAVFGLATALIWTAGSAHGQSLLNNGNQPGGNGGIMGPQAPAYRANPRDRYVPGQNNQAPLGTAPSNNYGQQSGSMYGSQPRR